MVRIFSGTREHLLEERKKLVDKELSTLELRSHKEIPRKIDGTEQDETASMFFKDMVHPAIDGFRQTVVVDGIDRLAGLSLFGCISKQNPRCDETLAQMEQVFQEITETFEFT